MKNIKIRYYLESKSSDVDLRIGQELIMAEISYGYAIIDKKGKRRYKPARFSLQETIRPNKFGLKENNFRFDEAIFKKSTTNNASIRTKMQMLEAAINELSVDCLIKATTLTPKQVNNQLASKLRLIDVIEPQISILDFIYSKIEKELADSGKSKKTSKKVNTIKTYKTVSHLIENYQIATSETLIFEDFDNKKYWGVWDILDDILKDKIKVINPNQPRKQRKQSYGYLVVSIRKYQKALLTTLRDAVKEGITVPLNVYDSNLILVDVGSVKSFYVESKIIKMIVDFDVSDNPRYQEAKDYFLIASLTGMRYESMVAAMKANIETCVEDKYSFSYIHSIHNKTSTEVFIPLLAPVVEIINSRGFPRIPSNPIINAELKNLFKYIGINRKERVSKVTYRSNKIETFEPLYDLISTHDCKGTFYSNLYSLGVSESVIDNITHPDRKPKNVMAKTYNKTTMLTKAKMFYDEVMKKESDVYTFR